MVLQRKSRIQLSPIKEMELAAARVPGAVSLAQGIPSFDTPEVIKDYVKEKLDEGLTAKYSLPTGLAELRELVAETLLAEGMRYDPDGEILITAGAIEAISATLIATTKPGQEVILPSPCYPSYQQAIRLAGCEPCFVPLDEERNFDLDVEAIAEKINSRTAAIFYCNPNNPTGTIYSRAQSLRMMELAEQHDLMIITDEVYKDFVYSGEPYFSPAQVEACRERVVRIFSLSKAYAMTGWRVGYLHSARNVVSEILKVHDALVTCAPVISQHAAVAALAYGQEAVREFQGAYRRRRDLMLQHLDELSHIFDYQKPRGAYFVFPRVKDTVPLAADSRALALDLLQRGRVALVPGVAFGPTGEGHLRMSFGREEADIEEAFRRMRPYFNRLVDGRAAVFPLHGSAPRGTALPDSARPSEPAGLRLRLRAPVRRLAVAYLHALARFFLWRRRPRVLAIAGNRGKTVFKRTLVELLRRKFATRANPRSYNTEIGLPLAVLGLEINPRDWTAILRTLLRATGRALFSRESTEFLVLELGARRKGDMKLLLRTVKPWWLVVTGLSAEEAEPGALTILQEEMAEACLAVPGERLLLWEDDALVASLRAAGGPPTIGFGRRRLEPAAGGHWLTGEKGRYFVGPEPAGESALGAVQAAVLLGEQLGMEREELEVFLRDFTGAAREPGESGEAPRLERA